MLAELRYAAYDGLKDDIGMNYRAASPHSSAATGTLSLLTIWRGTVQDSE